MNRLLLLVLLSYIFGCSPKTSVYLQPEVVELDTFNISATPAPIVFKGSETRLIDLIHTKLDLSFDWEESRVMGQAELRFKPYRRAINQFFIDARGFTLDSIQLFAGDQSIDFSFEYDENQLKINTSSNLQANQEYSLYIKYIATPDSLKEISGNAILSDKGLYFIKPDTENKRSWQLWTQGETEANSAWFPTVDAPNEKMTQEILLTVDTIYETLSNGIKLFENDNGDGTKTSFWKMDLPHAPYLTMLAIGDFEIVKDKWRNIEVSYYMEPEYAPYARTIFGLTPEMIEFYSELLDYDYPWGKFSQVAVKEFVSGAMENTSAVVHGDFILQTPREMLDQDYEDYIAHELFHHWFGDLVTCESWANLALNESFATYGEYLWTDHKYGRNAADYHLSNDLKAYLREARSNPKSIIRFNYDNNDALFDSHSYQKGGLVLHMLRNYLGDELFFEGIQLYLKRFEFNTAEIHDLRQCFEEVSGQDLNWFFNQWFFEKGHPELTYEWDYSEIRGEISLSIRQTQDFNVAKIPLFQLPIAIDLYFSDTIIRHKAMVNEAHQKVKIKVAERPLLVNFDADKMLVCEKNDVKPYEEWSYMFKNAPLFLDQMEAAEKIINAKDSSKIGLYRQGLEHDFWKIRQTFVYGLANLDQVNRLSLKDELIRLSQNDNHSLVRAAAIDVLSDYFKEDDLEGIYDAALLDSSYEVVSTALFAMYNLNKEVGLKKAKEFEAEDNKKILRTLSGIYANGGNAEQNAFYEKAANKVDGFDKFTFLNSYADYVERQNDSIALRSLVVYKTAISNENFRWIKILGVSILKSMKQKYEERAEIAKEGIQSKSNNEKEEELYSKMLKSAESILSNLDQVFGELRTSEKDAKIQKMLSP